MSDQHDSEVAIDQTIEPTRGVEQNSITSQGRVWDQLCELNKEVVEMQKTRAQIIGFKITAIAAGFAVLSSLHAKIPSWLLLLPAFTVIFFDLLITSQSVGIKRIGSYIANELEPFLKRSGAWPNTVIGWQEYVKSPSVRQTYALVGNLGFTLLIVLSSSIAFYISSPAWEAITLIVILIAFLLYDALAFLQPYKVIEKGRKREPNS